MEKKYELFYQEYKKRLYDQYPSVAVENLSTPPVSPFVITLNQRHIEEIRHLVEIVYKMIHLKEYSELINTDQSDYLKMSHLDSSLLVSYDFHLDQDNNLKLIEVNTHSSGYLVSHLVDQVHGMKKESDPSLLSLKKSFEQEWHSFSGHTSPPLHTLIADHQIKSQKMYIEFLMYKDLLNLWKWPCQLGEIENLSVNSQGILIDSQGKEVQMIYNRCTDFYFKNLPLLKKVFFKSEVLYFPSPQRIFIVGG